MKNLLLTVLVAILMTPASLRAEGFSKGETYKVLASSVRVRQSADSDSPGMGYVHRDQLLDGHKEKSGWIKITLGNGKTGYVFHKYLKAVKGVPASARPLVSALQKDQTSSSVASEGNAKGKPALTTKELAEDHQISNKPTDASPSASEPVVVTLKKDTRLANLQGQIQVMTQDANDLRLLLQEAMRTAPEYDLSTNVTIRAIKSGKRAAIVGPKGADKELERYFQTALVKRISVPGQSTVYIVDTGKIKCMAD